MKGFLRIIPAFLLLFFSACQKDIPVPESKKDYKDHGEYRSNEDLPVSLDIKKPSFLVRHHVKGDNLFIECKLTDISFRSDQGNQKQGKLLVSVNGRKSEEIFSPVFIIKGLPAGSHKITLEVVNLQNQPYQLKNEFMVTIP